MFSKINFRVLYTFFSAIFIIIGTLIAIQYAKGNIRLTDKGVVQDTGLLAANSFPTGAQVFINGELATATDDTLYLEPGSYNIEIKKDGFSPWRKTMQLRKELVTQTNAQLFPIAPSLIPLTFTGAKNISPSPDGEKIVFYSASASTDMKNGLYVLELNDSVLSFNKQAKQILTDKSRIFDFSNSQFVWSPDSTQLIIINPLKDVIVEIDKKIDVTTLPNVGKQKQQILSEWQEEMYLRERQFLAKFPKEIINIATQSAKNVYISPDKKRLLYTATKEMNLPENLVPPIPSTNTQMEMRQLSPENIYVYDREEDKNFLVGKENSSTNTLDGGMVKHLLAIDLFDKKAQTLEASPGAFISLQGKTDDETVDNFARYHTSLYTHGLQWFTDSKHLININENKIHIKEYDNSNETTIYSGPFEDSFVYPWPNGSKLVINTSFSPETAPNLYAIELK